MNTDQDLNDAISEHQHLVKVLRSTSHEDDRREAKKQAAELKTLRRKKVRDGLPAKPAPEAYPGVEPGDSLYIHHPERGPIAVKVHAQGRHGVTATDSEGHWHRAKWQHVLGAKQRLSQRLTLVDQGEDGAITEDESGQRRYVAIDPEAREDQEPLRKSQPTAAQIEAGNYRKEHRRFQGLEISIENPKGSVRAGTDPTGKPWRITMRHAYGYIRGTCGVDKDHVDCYLGPNPDASHAYVVHQRQAGKWSRYDEDKVMLGFDSAADAKAAYLSQYDDPRFFGDLTAIPMADFKRKALATRKRPQMIKGLVLFLKAVKTKSAHQGGLFDQVDPVKGYTTKQGVFVAPHQAKHKHAIKEAPTEKPDPTLSDDEKSAISIYSKSGYDYSYAYINDYLRTDAFDKRHNKADLDQAISRIDSGIAKSRTTAPVLYRGSKLVEYGLDRETIDNTLIGKVLTDKAFASTSLSKEMAADYAHQIGAILEITPQSDAPALELGDLAAIKSEQEVLLPRNAQLLVTAISTAKDGTPIIHANYGRPLQKALILFLKAEVKGHTRRLANGKIITVKPYRDKRGHQADKHSGELFGATPAPTPTPAPRLAPDPQPTPAPKPRKPTKIERLRASMADLFATVPDPEPTPAPDPVTATPRVEFDVNQSNPEIDHVKADIPGITPVALKMTPKQMRDYRLMYASLMNRDAIEAAKIASIEHQIATTGRILPLIVGGSAEHWWVNDGTHRMAVLANMGQHEVMAYVYNQPAPAPKPEPIPVETHFENARNTVVAHGLATGNELAVIINARTGETLESKEGTHNAVNFTDSMMAALRDPAQAVRVFHNHPSSSSLSSADLLLTTNPGTESIEAIGHDGSRYQGKALMNDRVLMGKIHTATASAIHSEISMLVHLRKVQARHAMLAHWHVVNTALAKAKIIEYESSLSSERNEAVKQFASFFTDVVNKGANAATLRLRLG